MRRTPEAPAHSPCKPKSGFGTTRGSTATDLRARGSSSCVCRCSLPCWLVWGKHYISISRHAFLAGGGWRANWLDVLIIGFIGLVFTGLAWKKLQKMQVNA